MSFTVKVGPASGHQTVITAGEQGVNWLGLDVLRLAAGESWQGKLEDEEAALIILGGRCTMAVGAEKWGGLGGRADMFAGPTTAVYAPRRSKIEVKADSKLEVAIAKAPSSIDLPAKLITADQVKLNSAGMANWRRDIRLYIPPGSPISQRMIIGETINPPGNWSGIPPHKHDEKSNVENFLEEFYLFKTKPANGDGIQMLAVDGEMKAHVLHNDDVAVFLNGYHPTAALPGTTVGYLWVLSGDSKAYDITIDMRYAWVAATEAVLKEMKN